jgi:hypothetical protein
MRRLDSLPLQHPFILWIDAEGYELEVVEGGLELIGEYCRGACVEITPSIAGIDASVKTLQYLKAALPEIFSIAGEQIDSVAVEVAITDGSLDQIDLLFYPKKKI